MTKPPTANIACVTFVFFVVTAITAAAQTLTTLVSFDVTNGNSPSNGSLVQGTDGNFYGTTRNGGAHGEGTVFKITAGGTLKVLYSFCAKTNCADGAIPALGLIQATDGNFYGTTSAGGGSTCTGAGPGPGCGTVFRITLAGALTTLHSFAGSPTDGHQPLSPLVQGGDGDFYGTTNYG